MLHRLSISLVILAGTAFHANADNLESSREAVSQLLKKDGGGLVAHQTSCPADPGNVHEFVNETQVVPINASSHAFLLNTEICGGGNKAGQYLVITQNGKSTVVTSAGIGDMSFLGKIDRIEGDTIYLSGTKWLENDPHCCPSKKAILEYNFRTGTHKYKITGKLSH